MAQYLQTKPGLSRPEALSLREVRECLKALIDLPTARLERLLVEHLDLCTYRLDAWQTGCFYRRLLQQRFPRGSEDGVEARVQGIYLGAFGWLEELRPGPAPTPADLSAIPTSLHNPERDGPVFEQPENGGFIHGPSLNQYILLFRQKYPLVADKITPDEGGSASFPLGSHRSMGLPSGSERCANRPLGYSVGSTSTAYTQ